MTRQRFDLLPIGKPAAVGLPYHGLVKNGKLRLPDSTELDWAPGSNEWSGATVMVRGKDRRDIVDLPDNQNENYTWQDYALLSGPDRVIGGATLGAAHWLYCDDSHVWLMYFEATGNSSSTTVKVYLKQLFGVFRCVGPAPTIQAPILLDEITFSAVSYSGGTVVTGYPNSYKLSHSEDGSMSLISVYASTGSEWIKSGITITEPACVTGAVTAVHGLHDVLKIQIEGNGAVSGTIGSGIEATITHYKNATELKLQDTGALSNPSITEYLFAYAVKNDGTIVNGKVYAKAENTVAVITEGPPQELRGTYDVERNVQFAGQSVSMLAQLVTYTIGATTTFESGFIGGSEMSVEDPGVFNSLVGQVTNSVSTVASTSVDAIRISSGGSANNASDYDGKIVGKNGQSLAVLDTDDFNFSYDPGSGEIATENFYTGPAICWV